MRHHTGFRIVAALTLVFLFGRPVVAEEPAKLVPLAIVGNPLPTIVLRDARRCRVSPMPASAPVPNGVRYLLPADEPGSIELTDEREGKTCGGSLYFLPQGGKGYAARLTPEKTCSAQLFEIDPTAQPAARLIRSDRHLDLDELICATRSGSPGSSRILAGGNLRGWLASDVKVEIANDGSCGKFNPVPTKDASGVELTAGVRQSVRVNFRVVDAMWRRLCEVDFRFTPEAGTPYFVEYKTTQNGCNAQLMRVTTEGDVFPAKMDPELAGCSKTP